MSTPTPEEMNAYLEAYREAYYNNIDSTADGNPAMLAGLAAAFEARDQRQAGDIVQVSQHAINALARLDGDPVDIERVRDEMMYWRNNTAAYAAAQRRATSREQAARGILADVRDALRGTEGD
jgi:hypothetical protein